MDQCRELAEVILALTLLAYPASGECLFEKHHGYKLSEPAKASVTHGVRGVFRCEQLCLDYANKCLAANVIFLEANLYRCEIFTELPDAFSTDQLLVNPGGKFIRRKGPHKLTIESCSTGTIQSSKYVCDNAYDGVLDPGDNNEWSGMKRDPNVWIQLNLPALEVVEIVKIWWRCSGSSQFSLLELNFSDGSRQTITHECSSNFNWLSCTADDFEVFHINPVATTRVHITGVDCELDRGYNGLREIELWSP